MKIKVTNEDRQLFREVVKKHGIVKESLLMTLFAKVLGHQIEKAVKNDKELQAAIKDADSELDKARVIIDDLIDMGITVPPYMKKYATKK
jgi:Mn-dependent DtxR family transcriptional regulator